VNGKHPEHLMLAKRRMGQRLIFVSWDSNERRLSTLPTLLTHDDLHVEEEYYHKLTTEA